MPEITHLVLSNPWYYTGDIGFLHAGELFVLGRKTDMIIVGGRKFYPNDIEQVVTGIDGVKEGRVVAFGVLIEERGTQEAVVAAESVHHAASDRVQAMKKEIKSRVLREIDCTVDQTRIVAPGSLIKTSSGKIARRDNCRWYLEHLHRGPAARD